MTDDAIAYNAMASHHDSAPDPAGRSTGDDGVEGEGKGEGDAAFDTTGNGGGVGTLRPGRPKGPRWSYALADVPEDGPVWVATSRRRSSLLVRQSTPGRGTE